MNSVVAFMAKGSEEIKNGNKKDIKCYNCKKTRHYSIECDKEETVRMDKVS